MLIKNSQQHSLTAGVSSCDSCGRSEGTTYEDRLAYVAQGATGRYCEVMWICDDCDDVAVALDVDAAREKCEAKAGAWADF